MQIRVFLWCSALLASTWLLSAKTQPTDAAAQWARQAAEALGGEAKLRTLTAVEVGGLSVWYQREQSERPEGPWIPTFTEFTDVRNIAAGGLMRTSRTRGYVTPDSSDWSPESTVLVSGGAGLRRSNNTLGPAGTPWDIAVLPVDLGPEHVVIAALDARDLRAQPDVNLHGYVHHVVAFTHAGARVRLILNAPSMLPKAVEITRERPFDIFWAPWGDVTHRVTFGAWLLEPEGVRYPRLWEYSTGGAVDGTVDITRVRINPTLVATNFEVPPDIRQSAIVNRRRIADLPLGSPQRPAAELAPGVVKVPGSWDIVEVKQDEGIVVIEGPLSSSYSAKVIEDVEKRFPAQRITAVITTSDAWPHIGGMREYVARGVAVYALDLNVPILERLFAAKYDTTPDTLAHSPKRPVLRVVSSKTAVGTGANRLEIYPLRTVSGERQMMVYFPEYRLLYTSDLFTIADGRVFLPQTVGEAVAAVNREHLDVTASFGMHYDRLAWHTVVGSAKSSPYKTP